MSLMTIVNGWLEPSLLSNCVESFISFKVSIHFIYKGIINRIQKAVIVFFSCFVCNSVPITIIQPNFQET